MKEILNCLLWIAIFYGLSSFASWDLHPAAWSDVARIICTLLSLIAIVKCDADITERREKEKEKRLHQKK